MSYTSEVLADSPLAYWKVDEASGNFADSSGNGRTGTVFGTGFTYQQPPGITTGFSVVNGSNGRAQYSAAQLVFPDSNIWTLEAWIKTTGNDMYFMDTGLGGPTLGIEVTTGKVVLVKSHSAVEGTSTVVVNNNAWHHVVAKRNGSGTSKIWVDGADVSGSMANNTFSVSASNRSGFGAAWAIDASGISNSFVGVMDEIAYYATALSDARIVAHYQAGITVAPANTVAPVASGSPVVGQVLSVTDGTWTGTATITFTYKWQRNGVDIGGATSNTYLLDGADLGAMIRAVVTGTNGAGAVPANSNALGPVTNPAPPSGGAQKLSRLVLETQPGRTIVLRG